MQVEVHNMDSAVRLFHDSSLQGYTGPWTTLSSLMNFGMNLAPDAG